MNKKKTLSVKGQLLLMSALPVLIIGVVLLIVISTRLRSGMMEQALEGLMASAEMYRTEIVGSDKVWEENELEDQYKSVTGFDFTRFEGDTRVSTSVVKSDGSRHLLAKLNSSNTPQKRLNCDFEER